MVWYGKCSLWDREYLSDGSCAAIGCRVALLCHGASLAPCKGIEFISLSSLAWSSCGMPKSIVWEYTAHDRDDILRRHF